MSRRCRTPSAAPRPPSSAATGGGCYSSNNTMPRTASHADADFVRDTNPGALAVFYQIQRRRSPAQKLADTFDLSEGLFELVKDGIRTRHPGAAEREVFLRAVATRLPRELMIRAYGWDPQEHV